MNVPDDSETGYILEVDLEYPVSLHDEHSDYPLAPENKTITDKTLSPHTIMFREKPHIKGSIPKLFLNLNNKKKYVTDYRNFNIICPKVLCYSKFTGF
jgi:hypothetical protein